MRAPLERYPEILSFWHFNDLARCATWVRDAPKNGHVSEVAKPTLMDPNATLQPVVKNKVRGTCFRQ